MLTLWVSGKLRKKTRERYLKAGRERAEQIQESETHSGRSKTPPKGIQRQEKGLRSTRDRS
jgi:hypothetical protein